MFLLKTKDLTKTLSEMRQLAAAFENGPMRARFSNILLKAAASCRTPKASPPKRTLRH